MIYGFTLLEENEYMIESSLEILNNTLKNDLRVSKELHITNEASMKEYLDNIWTALKKFIRMIIENLKKIYNKIKVLFSKDRYEKMKKSFEHSMKIIRAIRNEAASVSSTSSSSSSKNFTIIDLSYTEPLTRKEFEDITNKEFLNDYRELLSIIRTVSISTSNIIPNIQNNKLMSIYNTNHNVIEQNLIQKNNDIMREIKLTHTKHVDINNMTNEQYNNIWTILDFFQKNGVKQLNTIVNKSIEEISNLENSIESSFRELKRDNNNGIYDPQLIQLCDDFTDLSRIVFRYYNYLYSDIIKYNADCDAEIKKIVESANKRARINYP